MLYLLLRHSRSVKAPQAAMLLPSFHLVISSQTLLRKIIPYHILNILPALCLLMLGAVFMATDYVTSPMSHKGMLIYGVCIGLLTVIIRLFGAYPEGMSFAILIMNAFTPLINTYVKPKRFGEVAKKK